MFRPQGDGTTHHSANRARKGRDGNQQRCDCGAPHFVPYLLEQEDD
jgi:hypothetical protein